MRLSGVICCWILATVATAQDLKPFAGEVTASRLKLRAGPGPSYQPVVTVEKGSRVIVLGKHANNTDWYYVEVPQGYTAWVAGRYISKAKDGTAQVTTTRLLVRPRPSTQYHQLSGRLNLNEKVKVVEQKTMPDGVWYRIEVPRRIPLYAHVDFIRNIGPAALAQPKPKDPAPKAAPVRTDSDR
ncbi:MAG: SH3 domain-containing protein, partial [Planctomycetota bacterium]